MNDIQRGVLMMIRSAITGQSLALPKGFCLEEAEDLIVKHQIVGLAYEGAVLCGLPKTHPVMNRLFQRYCQIMMRSNAQMDAIAKLQDAFEHNGIDYMPVKGCILKKLYPKPAMRIMGDADILIRIEQRQQITQVMKQLGYIEVGEQNHEWIWDNSALHVELHKQLIPTYDLDYYNYIGDGWQRARQVKNCQYALSKEDLYLFLIVHFVKHYRGSGIGLRQAIDLWIYNRIYSDMDSEYLRQELEKVQLLTFHENLMRMLRVWFEDGTADERSLYMSQYIFGSGSWGTSEQREAVERYKDVRKTGSLKAGKTRMFLRMLFPPMTVMKNRYPILGKAPWLYPVLWPVRCVTAVLFRREGIRKYQKKLEALTPDNIETFQQSLEYVGLDYRL